MREAWKKAGIVLGHVVCIFVIIFCIANSQNLFGEQGQKVNTVLNPTVTIVPTIVPVSTPTQEPVITPAEILTPAPTKEPAAMPTDKPTTVPTEEPVATPAETASPSQQPTITPEATVIPTQEPIVTPEVTETPSQQPTAIPEVTVAPEATETPVPTITAEPTPTRVPVTDTADREAVKLQVLQNISDGYYSALENKKGSWWFRRKTDHVPSGSGEMFDISEYQGFYLNKNVEDGDKVIYMTIDCGYGSANTPLMLDIFKKHNIKVMFFVTKFFIDANPEYVKRMVEEGHMVGNHSVSHADLTALTDEEIYAEIIGCEEAFYKVTGQQLDLYFRPPEGAYSQRTLQLTEDLGYKTIFWSIAYNDYDKKNQPGREYVIDHFETYHHNGAIPLMHNDSQSNLEAMDAVLTLLEEQGYRFGTLDELEAGQ